MPVVPAKFVVWEQIEIDATGVPKCFHRASPQTPDDPFDFRFEFALVQVGSVGAMQAEANRQKQAADAQVERARKASMQADRQPEL